MSTAPERAENDKSKAPLLSRMEARRKAWAEAEEGRTVDDYRPDMPPVDGAEYLLGYLFGRGEIGIAVGGGMSAAAITHGDLRHWQSNSGIELRPWESRFLVALSHEYVGELQRATKLGCEPPWKQPDFKAEPTAAQLALRGLANG